MPPFQIDFLDHVAIRVKDLQQSAAWYEKVLGLKRYELPEWRPFPIFMLAGKSGVALFPANENHPLLDKESKNVKIDHFAFNVSKESFDKAIVWYQELGLMHSTQDHTYFKSLYTQDPDGHTVELTTLVVDENDFYTLE